jgi:hypothetical protein
MDVDREDHPSMRRSFLFTVLLLATVCGRGEEAAELPVPDLVRGEQLARAFCAACHSFNEPDLLPKKSWNFLLTYMGLRMGIEDLSHLDPNSEVQMDVIDARKTALTLSNLIPSTPMLKGEDWASLRAWYMEEAPVVPLPQGPRPDMTGADAPFEVKAHQLSAHAPVISLLRIDEDNRQLLIGDARAEKLTLLDDDLAWLIDYETVKSLWVDAHTTDDGIFLLSIADISGDYVGERIGQAFYGRRLGDMYLTGGAVLNGLYRPAAMAMGDLDGDGRDEMVVCNFGVETGDVSIYQREGEGPRYLDTPVRTLIQVPGAVACELHDFDRDGQLDVAVLFSDARENFSIFLNRGGLEFERKIIVESHAAFGYIGFQLVDFDHDGRMDVVTVNGDNVDSDPFNTLKRDHGIRVYLNRGDLEFELGFFYPMYGAYGVEAHDFDLDGDLDLAAIAFHPDFDAEQPEGFAYLEQVAPMEFTATTHPATFEGRWLTMDAGDLDHDGDVDLVLGAGYVPAGLSFGHPELLEKMFESGPALLFLDNVTIP